MAPRRSLSVGPHRRLFPRTEDWYAPCAVFTDELGKAIESASLHPGDSGFTQLGIANQEAANMIVRAGMDHFHKQYDFRGAWDALLSEAIKFGTYAGRLVLADVPVITNDFRGVSATKRRLPILVPVPIRNLYLDDSTSFLMQEGMVVQPSLIRTYWQNLGDLEQAARSPG
ncbi:hypothetical protein LCGC14_3016700, partial [marine sediment metagenome]